MRLGEHNPVLPSVELFFFLVFTTVVVFVCFLGVQEFLIAFGGWVEEFVISDEVASISLSSYLLQFVSSFDKCEVDGVQSFLAGVVELVCIYVSTEFIWLVTVGVSGCLSGEIEGGFERSGEQDLPSEDGRCLVLTYGLISYPLL